MTSRKTAFGLGLVTVGMFAYGVLGQGDVSVPDAALTPGAVLDTDPAVVCALGYDQSHRVWRGKVSTAAKYGIPWSTARDMEDDDLLPVGLGGDNANPKNHWLQPCSEWHAIGNAGLRECVAGEAFAKDQLEHKWEGRLRDACRTSGPSSEAAKTVLDQAQAYFLTGAWKQDM